MKTKIQNLEINMAELKTDIRYIKDGLAKNDEQHKEIIVKIDSFIQSAEDRFADKKDHKESMAKMDTFITNSDKNYSGKWVEKYFILIIILFAFASLYFIFQHVGLPTP